MQKPGRNILVIEMKKKMMKMKENEKKKTSPLPISGYIPAYDLKRN